MKYLKSYYDMVDDNRDLIGDFEWEINIIMNEMMSVSYDVIDISGQLIKIIEDNIKQCPQIKEDLYIYSNNVTISNITFHMSLKIYDTKDKSNLEKTNTKITYVNKDKYNITGSVCISDFKLTQSSEEILTHEVAHMWFMKNSFDNNEDFSEDFENWNKIYSNASKYLFKTEPDKPDSFNDICWLIYICDKQEVSAFMQQAWKYVDIDDCTNMVDVDRMVRKTDLYKYSKKVSEICEKIKSGEIRLMPILKLLDRNFDKKKLSSFKNLFYRRCDEYKKKLERLIFLKKSILRESFGTNFIFRDCTLQEIYNFNPDFDNLIKN